jgi:transcriptional regulator with XRE-family HTH domain
MPVFHGLDKALRWLRMQQRRKQREVAQAAGITQAMLCSYEQGKRHPSLRTLEKILDTLEVDLPRLSEVLNAVRQDPTRRIAPPPEPQAPQAAATPPRRPGAGTGSAAQPTSAGVDLYATLGVTEPLPPEQEVALRQMMQGFVTWLRLLHSAAATLPPSGPPDGP